MDATQGLRALYLLRPKQAIPIHYNDHTVFKSPLRDFQQAISSATLMTEVHYLNHGERYTFEVPQAGGKL